MHKGEGGGLQGNRHGKAQRGWNKEGIRSGGEPVIAQR